MSERQVSQHEPNPNSASFELDDKDPLEVLHVLQAHLERATEERDQALKNNIILGNELDEAHLAIAVRDTEIKELTEELTAAASTARTEVLTKLSNQLALEEAFHEIVDKRNELAGTVVIIIYIDVNRFKDVNDTLGHDTGDEVLKGIAIQLKNAVRYGDLVVRKGGDELVVLATISREESNGGDPERTQTRVDSITERLREDIILFMSEVTEKIPGFGVSVGNSSFTVGPDTTMETIDTTMKESDRAMYRDKERIKGIPLPEAA